MPTAAAEPKVRIDTSPTSIVSSSGFHLLELHGPTISAVFLMGLATMSTASLALFIYRMVSKRRRRKEARIDEEARKDTQSTMLPLRHPRSAPYQWSPAGPTTQEHQHLPILLAMARKIEEDEFRRGAGRLTEVWDTQSTIPLRTPPVIEQPRRTKRGLEEELEEIVTGVPGATKWESGKIAPKHYRSAHQPLQ